MYLDISAFASYHTYVITNYESCNMNYDRLPLFYWKTSIINGTYYSYFIYIITDTLNNMVEYFIMKI